MTTSSIKPTFTTIIVDDNDMQRYIVKKRFVPIFKEHHFSFSIEEAENGKRAWEICKNHEFDFYVIDFQMPLMNGVKLCRKLFDKYPYAQVVLYSETKIEEIEKSEGLIGNKHLNEVVDYIPKDCLQLQGFLEKILEKNSDKFQIVKEAIEDNL